jgi:hypothetical protein
VVPDAGWLGQVSFVELVRVEKVAQLCTQKNYQFSFMKKDFPHFYFRHLTKSLSRSSLQPE